MARNSTAADAQQQDTENEPRLWHGLIAFATIMLLLLGAFHLIGGFVALFEDDQYLVGERDLMVTVSYRWFGIAHMAIGVLMMLAAYALFWGRTWGRAVAIVAASGQRDHQPRLPVVGPRPVHAHDRARPSRDLCRGRARQREPGVLSSENREA